MEKQCGECGAIFVEEVHRGPKRSFCSPLCKRRHYNAARRLCRGCKAESKRHESWTLYCAECRPKARAAQFLLKQCEGCLQLYIPALTKPYQRFCSRACGSRFQPRSIDLRPSNHRRPGNRLRGRRERVNRQRVFERDGWICGICRSPVDQTLRFPHPMSKSFDHVIPLDAGGDHTEENGQLAHLSCNSRKRNRHGASFSQADKSKAA